MKSTPGISRRTVTRGLAWTAPVLVTAVAAPAYASSLPCHQGEAVLLNPGTGTVVTTLAFPPSLVTAEVTYSAQLWVDQTPAETGQVRTAAAGWNYVKLQHDEGPAKDDTVTMTISFSEAVKNLSLTVHNIDKVKGDFIDEVYISPTTASATLSPRISGSGTEASPFKAAEEGIETSGLADVNLVWSHQLQQVQITLRAGDEDNQFFGGQHVGVGRISFNNCP